MCVCTCVGVCVGVHVCIFKHAREEWGSALAVNFYACMCLHTTIQIRARMVVSVTGSAGLSVRVVLSLGSSQCESPV